MFYHPASTLFGPAVQRVKGRIRRRGLAEKQNKIKKKDPHEVAPVRKVGT